MKLLVSGSFIKEITKDFLLAKLSDKIGYLILVMIFIITLVITPIAVAIIDSNIWHGIFILVIVSFWLLIGCIACGI